MAAVRSPVRTPGILGLVAAAALLAACTSSGDASDDGATTPASGATSTAPADDGSGAVPTPEDLATALLTPADLEGDWSVMGDSGVVDGEPLTSVVDAVCGAGDVAPGPGTWQAGTYLVVTAPPGFPQVLERLTAGEPEEMESAFSDLVDQLTACLGALPPDQGRRPEAVDIPALGDAAFAVAVVESSGGADYNRIPAAVILDGPVLLAVAEGGSGSPDAATAMVSDKDFASVVAVAVDKLP